MTFRCVVINTIAAFGCGQRRRIGSVVSWAVVSGAVVSGAEVPSAGRRWPWQLTTAASRARLADHSNDVVAQSDEGCTLCNGWVETWRMFWCFRLGGRARYGTELPRWRRGSSCQV
jgi:hypothetical protein